MPVRFPRLTEHRKCSFTRAVASAVRLCALAIAGLLLLTSSSLGQESELRLRIAWGGGASRLWRGTISVSEGVLSELELLGLEADEPGSMRLDRGVVSIEQRSPRAYDALDLLVRARPDATLRVELASPEQEGTTRPVEVPLSDLVCGFHNSSLDAGGNRLLIRRAPGDRLRVRYERDSLVFSPQERFELEVSPHLLGLKPNTPLRRRTQLIRVDHQGRVEELWVEEEDVHVAADGSAPAPHRLQIDLPAAEGVYDLVISLAEKRLADRFVQGKQLMVRKVQLVVIDPQPPASPAARWRQEAEIDPAKPNRWRQLVQHLPGVSKDTVSVGRPRTREHLGRTFVQLGPKQWQGYFLPVSQPGAPHIFEIEYPNDLPQTLGVSILEPNAAGKVAPIGLDSGFDVPTSPVASKPAIEKHRLLFWPRTASPLVLLTNHRDDDPAFFGALRVLSGPASLPAARTVEGEDQRLLAVYFDKPLFPESFSAREALDQWTSRSLDDWVTFYEGGRRLAEYVTHIGYNGVVLSAACEGGAIYPSKLLAPTPKYDTGVFFMTGQDPQRKDVLEMLFRLFDRQRLRLVPALQFCSPLLELQWLLSQGEPDAVGVELIGADGASWAARAGARRGMAAYYNPLDQRVQDAMRRVVKELVERYSHHPSFAGVALQLGIDTYAQLPSEWCAYDDRTIARFEQEQNIAAPGQGPERFRQRAAFLEAEPVRERWLKWRARTLAQLYRDIQRDVAQRRQDAKLYLAAAELFNSPQMQRELRPTLPVRADISDAMLQVGIDAALYRDEANIVLLRPQRFGPLTSLAAQAVNIQLDESPEVDVYFGGDANGNKLDAATGGLFYHEPLSLRLPSFDAVSPFGPENTETWLLSHISPSGQFNRRRFVRSLAALDSQFLADGGWMALLGQEEALRSFVEVYRRLPAERFETVPPKAAAGQTQPAASQPGGAESTAPQRRTQPVVVRKLAKDDRTYIYVLNDAPWPVQVAVNIDAPYDCRLAPLGSQQPAPLSRQGRKAQWRVSLEAYGIAAATLSSTDVQIESWTVDFDDAVPAALGEELKGISQRVEALRNPPALPVLANPGFELADGKNALPGWVAAQEADVAPDTSQSHSGRQSLRLHSDSDDVWIRSDPFDTPRTGRLAGWVWLKVQDQKRQPPLRLAIEGRHNGQTYYRFARVGALDPAFPIGENWGWYTFQADDLPPSGLTDLRVGFDLMGKGEVWIDDVQLFDLWFSKNERNELTKNIALADLHLGEGQVGDCLQFLDGYWPRFLKRHVPFDQPRVAASPAQRNRAADQAAPKSQQGPPREKPRSFLDRWRHLAPRKVLPF